MAKHAASLIKQCVGGTGGTPGYVGKRRWDESEPRTMYRLLDYRGERMMVTLLYCHIHDQHEEVRGEESTRCFECGHIYKNMEEIVEEHLRNTDGDTAAAINAAERFCPFCLHDWI